MKQPLEFLLWRGGPRNRPSYSIVLRVAGMLGYRLLWTEKCTKRQAERAMRRISCEIDLGSLNAAICENIIASVDRVFPAD